jgi:hypothetical protein
MAKRIALLHRLRAKTTELIVSTLITDPIPESVLHIIMSLAEGCLYPFANDAANVAYGCIDEQRRMAFGANATALRDPDFATIAGTMHATFPKLAEAYPDAPLVKKPYFDVKGWNIHDIEMRMSPCSRLNLTESAFKNNARQHNPGASWSKFQFRTFCI